MKGCVIKQVDFAFKNLRFVIDGHGALPSTFFTWMPIQQLLVNQSRLTDIIISQNNPPIIYESPTYEYLVCFDSVFCHVHDSINVSQIY